jgi:hypothetical protein
VTARGRRSAVRDTARWISPRPGRASTCYQCRVERA